MNPEDRIAEAIKQVRITKKLTDDYTLAEALQEMERDLENARDYMLEAEQ